MATTDERNDVVDLTRADSDGDDIAVVPDGNGSGGRGRGRWIWLGAGAAAAIALIVVLVATLGSSDSNSTVKTAGATAAAAPVATVAPDHTGTLPAPHATDTTIAVKTPVTAVTHVTVAPTHDNNASSPAPPPPAQNNTPPPTAPPKPLGPSALTWRVPTTWSISKDGATFKGTVQNGNNGPAYTPTPLNCLQYGDRICGQHTQTLQAHESFPVDIALDASQFSNTPTAVYLGGYFKVMITA